MSALSEPPQYAGKGPQLFDLAAKHFREADRSDPNRLGPRVRLRPTPEFTIVVLEGIARSASRP